ncbi:hypothetical protein MIND_01421600 [Mycena indigotica]|uniref:F-box domain-containing protein n=1 Tax=Mycena indigotica TaxID=2126181 RepID=A0A8H6RYL6_9AGAR|nr:uncharacterized protein MIND_01421600 [Mycena indigotica]KAF7288761.1 hypothetical protein MIND_01421600 [Mycena indigotica]
MPVRPALDILPRELWETLFDLLSEDLLLKLARVCRFFNARCLDRFLYGSLSYIGTATRVSIDSCGLLALPLCVLWQEFPIEVLICEELDASDLPNLLSCLDRVILRSPKLHTLYLNFNTDLLADSSPYNPHKLILPYETRALVLPRLCQTLSLFSHRNNSDHKQDAVFAFTERAMFSCSAGDLADWELHKWRFNHHDDAHQAHRGSRRRGAKKGQPEVEEGKEPPWNAVTSTRLFDGRTEALPVLRSLLSANARLIKSSHTKGGGWKSSLVVLNQRKDEPPDYDPGRFFELFNNFELSRSMIHIASEECLKAVMNHARIRWAETLSLDPSIGLGVGQLRRFLANHHRLKCIRVRHGYSRSPKRQQQPPILDAPLRHPSLERLKLRGIPAFPDIHCSSLIKGLINSPNLALVTLSLYKSVSKKWMGSHTDNIISALSGIARRHRWLPSITLELTIDWSYGFFTRICRWADDPRALDIAAKLHSVERMRVEVSSVGAGRRLLRWCSLLPRLQSFVFKLDVYELWEAPEHKRREANEAFRAEAMAAFQPRVLTISYETKRFSF